MNMNILKENKIAYPKVRKIMNIGFSSVPLSESDLLSKYYSKHLGWWVVYMSNSLSPLAIYPTWEKAIEFAIRYSKQQYLSKLEKIRF